MGLRAHRAAPTLALTALLVAGGVLFAAPGDLDTSFDTDGLVTTQISGGSAEIRAVAVAADGKIVAAGTDGGAFALARYHPDGRLDTTFGTNGTVLTFTGPVISGGGVVIAPNGKIFVGGHASQRMVMARYDATGTLEKTSEERMTSSTDMTALVRQPDGKLLLAGYAPNTDGNVALAVARFDEELNLDPTYGVDGIASTQFRGLSGRVDVVLQSGDRAVVIASRPESGGTAFGITRFTSAGVVDRTFGVNGYASVPFPIASMSQGLAEQSDGKLVVVGGASTATGNPVFGIARFSADGAVDTQFGDGGSNIFEFPGVFADGSDVVIQPDGRLVVVGQLWDFGGPLHFAVARFEADGSVDQTFGECGGVFTDWGGRAQAVKAVLQSNGTRLIALGRAAVRPVTDFALARYDLTGAKSTQDCDDGGGGGGNGDDLDDVLPSPDDAPDQKTRKTRKKLDKLLRQAQKKFTKAESKTGKKQTKLLKGGRKKLQKILKTARAADRKGTLGEPLEPIETVLGAFIALLP